MLSLARPEALLIALAALPVALLYFLRMRFRRKAVGSTYIWRQLAGATSGGDALKRRSVFLLLLQLMAIALAAVAASGPSFVSRRTLKPGTAFLIDVSASMAFRDCSVGGERASRVEAAVAQASREIAALGADVPIMAFACAASARALLAEPTLDKGKAIASLRGLKAGSDAFREAACADTIASWLSRAEGGWRARLLTDGGLDLDGQRLASAFGGQLGAFSVGTSGASLGVTGLRLERGVAGGSRASFELWNGWPSEKSARVRISRGEEELASALVSAAPGWSRGSVELKGGIEDGAYAINIDRAASGAGPGAGASTADAGSAPGGVYRLSVSAQRTLSVLVVGKIDPFLKAALAFGGISYASATDYPASFEGIDVVVAEQSSGSTSLPSGANCNLLVFGDPPKDAPVSARGRVGGAIVSTDPSHPLSRFVNWEGARAEGARAYSARGDALVLATVDGAPVLVAWERRGYRSLAFGVDLSRSDLGLKSAFPVLVQNFLQWCVPRVDDQSAYTLVVGETARRALPASFSVRGVSIDLLRTGPTGILTPKEAGFFAWDAGAAGPVSTGSTRPAAAPTAGYIAANVPAEELDLAPREPRAAAAEAAGSTAALASTDETRTTALGVWLIALLAACLATEWLIWKGGSPKRAGHRKGAKA